MKLKINHIAALSLLVFLVATSFASCRDKCKRVTCINGTCVDGTCNCDAGYFQEDCGAVINAGLIGQWTSSETCTAGSDGGPVNVLAAGSSKTDIKLLGLWDFANDTVHASLGSNGLDVIIARQSVDGLEIEGEGLANAAQDEVNLTYRIYNAGQSSPFDICTAALTKN